MVCNVQALWISPREPYELHWPVRRGRPVSSRGHVSKESVLADLESLWAAAIKEKLGIEQADFKVRVSLQPIC